MQTGISHDTSTNRRRTSPTRVKTATKQGDSLRGDADSPCDCRYAIVAGLHTSCCVKMEHPVTAIIQVISAYHIFTK